MTWILLASWLALNVHGDLTCPTPAEVSRVLTGLVPARAAKPAEGRAYLSASGGFVTIELWGLDGGLMAERRLDSVGSCAEMAEAVAVILAAWQADLSPRRAQGVTELPAAAAVSPAPESAAGPPVLFDVGAAALTSLVSGKAELGGKVEGVLLPFASPLGFHLAAAAASSHTQTSTSPPVGAQWIRPALSAGPNLRWRGQSFAVDVHGDAVLALQRVKGVGLTTISSDTSVQFGLAAGLRGLRTWNHIAAWIGTDLLVYQGQDNLTVGNSQSIGRLPHLELQVTLGFSLGRFR